MKKVIFLTLCTIILSQNAQATMSRCAHAGIGYIDIQSSSSCPDYAGGDAGLPTGGGWVHKHTGDNTSAYHEGPDGQTTEDLPSHCLITKTLLLGPGQEIQ